MEPTAEPDCDHQNVWCEKCGAFEPLSPSILDITAELLAACEAAQELAEMASLYTATGAPAALSRVKEVAQQLGDAIERAKAKEVL